MKRLLWWLIAGSKGGVSRARIIILLHERPYNTNQITKKTGMDYKTIQHHIRVLEENGVITSFKKKKYGTMYFLSDALEKDYHIFNEIWEQIKED